MSLGDIAIFILVGLVAGFLASLVVTGRGRGCLGNLVIGILGAIIGGWLASFVHVDIGSGVVRQIVVAFVGAVILLLLWRLIFHRDRKK